MSDVQVTEVKDVLTMVIPESLGIGDPRTHLLVYSQCVQWVHAQFKQYPEAERPTIHFDRIDTLITDDFETADAFQPAHECDKCLEGTRLTAEFLRDHPGRFVALANIYYTERL